MPVTWENTKCESAASDNTRCSLFAHPQQQVPITGNQSSFASPSPSIPSQNVSLAAKLCKAFSDFRNPEITLLYSTLVRVPRRVAGFFWAGVKRGWAKVGRILDYLLLAEHGEPDAWFRDDYTLARMVLGKAFAGHPKPYEQAFRQKYGTSPEKALAFWAERDAETQLYLTPRKQPTSVKETAKDKKAGAE